MVLGDLEEIEEVNANCIFMANLQQASTSNLEVAFRRNTCFVRNLEGVDLLKGNCTTNLYTINIHEMASASPIFLMTRATSTKSWLWHQRLSNLNLDTINDLVKNDLITGLSKFKYHKQHLCPLCEQGKSKKASHLPKLVPNSKQRLHLLHMDLCGPMRVESINRKWYVLVIVDDYSYYTWVHFLRSKDKAPEEINIFLKKITVLLQAPVIIVRTDNGIEFKNQVLQEYFNSVGISHQASSVKTPQQNRVVGRRNKTLVEAARTMLIFSRAPLFLWLINGKKPDISFLHVFGALCYPKNDHEDIGKLDAKGDIGFFIGYYATSCAYRVYNRRTKKIMETMNVTFDELSTMAFEQRSSKPGLQSMTSRQISSGLNLTYAPSIITSQKPTEHELDSLFEAMYHDYIGGQSSAATRTAPAAPAPQVLQNPMASTTIADITSTPTNSSPQAIDTLITSHDVDALEPQQHVQQQENQDPLRPKIVVDNVPNAMFDEDVFEYPFSPSTISVVESSSSQYVVYVDDIIFASTNPRYTQLFADLMKSYFEMSMMGEMTFFLGLQVNQSTRGIFINQSKYVLEIFKKYGMESCDPIGTPMDIKDKLDLDQNGTLVDAMKYQSMIGALMYLMSSRPDIVHATCLCARYQAKPTEKHLKEVKRIFRYLRGTVNMDLWYTKDSGFELTEFLDDDYVGCKDTFKSTSVGT
ncbi:retrovirus-related pol polyprotein from transposon TNT 1-94 [Tanacetum coccineum]